MIHSKLIKWILSGESNGTYGYIWKQFHCQVQVIENDISREIDVLRMFFQFSADVSMLFEEDLKLGSVLINNLPYFTLCTLEVLKKLTSSRLFKFSAETKCVLLDEISPLNSRIIWEFTNVPFCPSKKLHFSVEDRRRLQTLIVQIIEIEKEDIISSKALKSLQTMYYPRQKVRGILIDINSPSKSFCNNMKVIWINVYDGLICSLAVGDIVHVIGIASHHQSKHSVLKDSHYTWTIECHTLKLIYKNQILKYCFPKKPVEPQLHSRFFYKNCILTDWRYTRKLVMALLQNTIRYADSGSLGRLGLQLLLSLVSDNNSVRDKDSARTGAPLGISPIGSKKVSNRYNEHEDHILSPISICIHSADPIIVRFINQTSRLNIVYAVHLVSFDALTLQHARKILKVVSYPNKKQRRAISQSFNQCNSTCTGLAPFWIITENSGDIFQFPNCLYYKDETSYHTTVSLSKRTPLEDDQYNLEELFQIVEHGRLCTPIPSEESLVFVKKYFLACRISKSYPITYLHQLLDISYSHAKLHCRDAILISDVLVSICILEQDTFSKYGRGSTFLPMSDNILFNGVYIDQCEGISEEDRFHSFYCLVLDHMMRYCVD